MQGLLPALDSVSANSPAVPGVGQAQHNAVGSPVSVAAEIVRTPVPPFAYPGPSAPTRSLDEQGREVVDLPVFSRCGGTARRSLLHVEVFLEHE